MTQESIKCEHCKGSGTCDIGKKSCAGCLKSYSIPITSNKFVPCNCCHGLGVNSWWNINTRESTSKPVENTLTGYMIKQEQESNRYFDKRRFWITIIYLITGFLLIILGFKTNLMSSLLPVASALMTGAFGYYVGRQSSLFHKNYEDTKYSS